MLLRKVVLNDKLCKCLYRHGDRSPISSYPNDPYYDPSYWPNGYGQLLNKGIERQYELGQWFRDRYRAFLPEEYSPSEIKVISTDVDRTLMSAAANLAGLYPPPASQVWNDDLLWEPIPIHTKTRAEDEVLAMEKPCARHSKLEKDVDSSDFFKNITTAYADFFDTVTNYTGRSTTTLGNIENLNSVFYVYRNHNASYLPSWADDLDQHTLSYLAGVEFSKSTFTDEMKRLKVGPFFDYLTSYFDDIVGNVSDTPKFVMLSAHDSTVSSVLNGMGAFDYWPPEFASTVFWELRRSKNGTHYVNLLYKRNSTNPVEELRVSDCDFNCDYNDFKEKLSPIIVGSTTWESECIIFLIEIVVLE
ncbi:hypothetical protein NQ317_017976 [Molorchus minor]|uniref:acid phosphatase n=1 Tax=Molorchus minor TaxID=1323400 RepID=A0ABQ9JBZ2_9CUCU|nr:hypothetical protein NQ317_017976 [Molorchus minor]